MYPLCGGYKNKVVKRCVQAAANIGDISAVYKITKEVTNSGPNVEHPAKDIDGSLLSSDEDQMVRWISHFFFGA